MQVSAVTIEEAKRHLRITGSDQDALLGQKLEAAADHVAAFIGGPLEVDGQVPPAVREAVLQATAMFFDGTPADLGGLLAAHRQWAF